MTQKLSTFWSVVLIPQGQHLLRSLRHTWTIK